MKKGLPASIWVAGAALFLAIAALTLLTAGATRRPAWGQLAFAGLLAVLIVGGVLGKRRLAWLWGHYLSLFLAIIQAATLGLAWWRGAAVPWQVALTLSGVSAAFLVAFLALGRRSALGWFDLLCPACGTPSRMGADFLFRQARCRKCGEVW
ncbi:MAG: hypothetical protein HZB56_22080 [Deltaproteobacteria bacterium]|nr:hypothetical protein [Deltaproteobacteria bacterium]